VTERVLDASALIALLLGEPGHTTVRRHLADSYISAVNYSEVLARTGRLCGSPDEAKRRVDRHDVTVIPFDAEQAAVAAAFIPATRAWGLSFADRACLALGTVRSCPVLTADHAWAKAELPVRVELVR
jgi:ribonuclease VapC